MQEIGGLFVEVLVAPAYTADALAWLAEHKKNCRVMMARAVAAPALVLRSVRGGLLAQTPDDRGVDESIWQVVTRRQPTEAERRALDFAWLAAKHVKSNAIVLVQGTATVGVGAGQMNRVDSVYLAARRAGDRARGVRAGIRRLLPVPGWHRGGGRSRRDRHHPARRVAARRGGHRRGRPAGPGDGLHRRAALQALAALRRLSI